jgi:hypothetical protein
LGGLESGFTLSVDKHGYEHVLIVAKATFDIQPDGRCSLSSQQHPVTLADEHRADPGASSIRYECDFAAHKPLADVIVNGSAYAQHGEPTTEVEVGLAIGSIRKLVRVVGDRVWERALPYGYQSSPPQPFTSIPLVYERAFGGVDARDDDVRNHGHELRNLVGTGFFARGGTGISGTRLPNLEHPQHPLRSPGDHPPPVGFGFVSRNWSPRYTYAGTYDQAWRDHQFPFLPEDFNDRYYQGAPEDQQCPYLQGGERVVLLNLTPEGRMAFELPRIDMPMRLVFRLSDQILKPNLDTLIVEPDARRCILVWRASTKLTSKLTDILEVWVGQPSRARQLALEGRKRYIDWTEKVS